MKTKMYLVILTLLLGTPTMILAQPPANPIETTATDSSATNTNNSAINPPGGDTNNNVILQKEVQAAIDIAMKGKLYKPINIYIVLTVSILFFLVMLYLFFKFFNHITKNGQYIGFQSIKLIGLILMFPGICILAMAGNNLIEGSTLAALLGTIAGYVLSREDDSKTDANKKENATLKQEKEALETKYKTMETELNTQIEALKAQLPH